MKTADEAEKDRRPRFGIGLRLKFNEDYEQCEKNE